MPVDTLQDPASREPKSWPAAPEAPISDPAHLLPAHASEGAPRRRYTGLIIAAVVLLSLLGVAAWRIHSNQAATAAEANKASAAASRPTPVQVVPVQQRTVPVFLTALGTVSAYNTVMLHSRIDGQIMAIHFTEGQAVRKGQLLLEIDPRPLQATLAQAQGTLAKDQANLGNATAEAQRYTALFQAGVISKESQQLQVANQGQASGTIKADQAAIEAARVQLGYTRITSPIDGVVGLRGVDIGNIVHASDANALVTITQIHPIAVVFTLPEDQLPQVQKAMKAAGGQKLAVEAYDRGDAHQIASGTLLTIDNEIDTTTGTAKLKAVFPNTDNSLFSNQFVNVRLILRQRENALVVPTAAIQTGTQGDFVFIVNPGPTPAEKRKNMPSAGGAGAGGAKAPIAAGGGATAGADSAATGKDGKPRAQFHADSVPVHVDFTIGTNSVIAPGTLQGGQPVVVDGQERLVDGGNVQPQQRPAPGNPNGLATGGGTAASGGPGGVGVNGAHAGGHANDANGGHRPSSSANDNGGGAAPHGGPPQ